MYPQDLAGLFLFIIIIITIITTITVIIINREDNVYASMFRRTKHNSNY